MIDLKTLRLYNITSDNQYSYFESVADDKMIIPNFFKDYPNELVFTQNTFHKKEQFL